MKLKELLEELEGYDPESEILVLFTGMETICKDNETTTCQLYDEHRKLNIIESGYYSSNLNEYYNSFAARHLEEISGLPIAEWPKDVVPAILLSNQFKI